MMLIVDFGRKHEACRDGIDRALALGHETMEAVWADERMDASDRIWTATQPGVLTDKELRLFAVWSARQVQHLMTDPRSIVALDVAERHAHGEATDEELAAARAAARDAAWTAARAAARDAAWTAARDAAWAAAWAAARDAAWDAARDAAWDAAWDAQSSYLLANTKPVFA
jgi:hypothetical protein